MDALSLDKAVRKALNDRRGEWRLIASEADISYSWMSQFVRGKIPNPGYETLRTLARVLHLRTAPATAAEAQA